MRYYNQLLRGLEGIRLPEVADGGEHIYLLFVSGTERRDELRDHLHAHGIATGLLYCHSIEPTAILVIERKIFR